MADKNPKHMLKKKQVKAKDKKNIFMNKQSEMNGRHRTLV